MKSRRFSFLAAAAGLLTVTAAPLAAQSVRDGILAWQRADYAAAVAIWRPLAENGDADAAFNLGQSYRLGRGVKIDLALAQSWLEKAARAGHLDAQTTLGLLLFDSGNRDAALQWLKKAAERGEPRAMLVYGTALFNGDGANDRLMIEEAGLGVAWRAKPALAEVADARIDHHGLDALLWAQGIRKKEWVRS